LKELYSYLKHGKVNCQKEWFGYRLALSTVIYVECLKV